MTADLFFLSVTWLGSLYVLGPAAFLVWLLARAGGYGTGHLPLLGLFVTAITVHLLKLLFRRARPDSLGLLVEMPGDWSFPSAHSAQAASFFLTLALLASRTMSAPAAALCIIVCLAVVVTVGWSRVYLRVHYPSDVLAGFLLAVIVVTTMHFLFPPAEGHSG